MPQRRRDERVEQICLSLSARPEACASSDHEVTEQDPGLFRIGPNRTVLARSHILATVAQARSIDVYYSDLTHRTRLSALL